MQRASVGDDNNSIMRRYQILSLVFFAALLSSLAVGYAAHSAARFQQRGTTVGFPQPVTGAESLRLGVNTDLQQFDDATLDERLSDLHSRGVRYLRQEFRWTDIEPVRGQYDWSVTDRIMSAAVRHEMQVLAVLVTTPAWARAESGSAQTPATETMPPRDPSDFASFALAFAQRFDGRQRVILGYQIWDEPNLSAMWGDALINPLDYLNLLRAARTAIHTVNPSALIVLAGLAPTVEQTDVNLAPEVFLSKLYAAGGRDSFDIVAAKPYGFESPPDDRRTEADTLNFSRVILIRETMVAYNDEAKAIWMTQWGWNAQLPGWSGRASIWSGVSETQQSRYTLQAVERAANEWHWVGAMFLSTLQPSAGTDGPLWGFALLDQQSKPRPVYDALAQALAVANSAPRAQWAAERTSAQADGVYSPNPAADYSEGWRFGNRGADIPQREDARMTVRFNGDSLAMIVRRDDYRAYMFIRVDGQPANLLPVEERGAYLILSSPDRLPRIDTIEVANNLGQGSHVADITIDRGWNQWALVGWTNGVKPDISSTASGIVRIVAGLFAVMSAFGLAISWRRANWRMTLQRLAPRAREWRWQTWATAVLLWLSASLTWAQDAATAYRNLGTPVHVVITGLVSGVAFWSPLFVISLLALAALFVLVLLRLDVGLAVLAFFIPFYLLPQRIFAWAFPMVELLMLMCAASWLLSGIRAWRAQGLRRISFHVLLARFSILDWGVLAFVLVAALSASQADFRVEAARELRMVILGPALVYLILRSQKLSQEQVWRIVDGLVLGAVVIAFVGLVNYARGYVFPADFGIPRIRSVYGSPNNDALYLGRALPILLAVAALARSAVSVGWLKNRRLWYVAGAVLVASALVLSVSRGALLLGAPAAVVCMCLLAGGRWRVLGVVLLVAAAIGLGVMLSGALNPWLEGTRFANALDLTRGTGFFRMNLWQSAITMWQDHPWLGVGPDNFLYAYRGHYILPAAWQEPNLSHPHNIAIDILTRLGVLGVGAFVLITIGVVRRVMAALAQTSNTALKPVAIGLTGLLVGTVMHGMVDHSLFLVDLMYVSMLALGLLTQLSRYVIPGDEKTLSLN